MTTTITIVIDDDQGTLVAKNGLTGIVRSFAVDSSADDAEAAVATELAAAFTQLRAIKANPPSTAPAPKPKPAAAPAKKPSGEAKKAAAAPAKPAADAEGFGQVDMFAF